MNNATKEDPMTTESTTTPAADGITYGPSWGDVAEASSEAERANKFAPRPVMHTVSVPLTGTEPTDLDE